MCCISPYSPATSTVTSKRWKHKLCAWRYKLRACISGSRAAASQKEHPNLKLPSAFWRPPSQGNSVVSDGNLRKKRQRSQLVSWQWHLCRSVVWLLAICQTGAWACCGTTACQRRQANNLNSTFKLRAREQINVDAEHSQKTHRSWWWMAGPRWNSLQRAIAMRGLEQAQETNDSLLAVKASRHRHLSSHRCTVQNYDVGLVWWCQCYWASVPMFMFWMLCCTYVGGCVMAVIVMFLCVCVCVCLSIL